MPSHGCSWTGPLAGRSSSSSIKPALSRSEARLAGEAPFGLVPFRIMIPSYVLEAFLVMAVIFVQVKIEELRPYVAPRLSSHDVIYYTGDELPRTEDLGGAETGRAGRVGGDEAHHRTQTIKIARGGSLVPQVVDAPNLKLPSSTDAVANLLAVKPESRPASGGGVAFVPLRSESGGQRCSSRSKCDSRLHAQRDTAGVGHCSGAKRHARSLADLSDL